MEAEKIKMQKVGNFLLNIVKIIIKILLKLIYFIIKFLFKTTKVVIAIFISYITIISVLVIGSLKDM